MTSFVRRRRALAATVLIGLTVSLSAGCSSAVVGDDSPSPTATETAAPLAVSIPMPDLGPSPTTAPLADAEKEQLRLAAQDALWTNVAATYPDAARPGVLFTEYVTGESRVDVLSACFSTAGLPIETGSSADGTVLSVNARPTTEAEALSAFVCNAEHPSEPVPLPSDAQLGYVYDYLTRFLAPCYAANGITNPPPPSRQDFVAKWPNQGWFPSLGDLLPGPTEEAIYTACPILI